MSRKYFGLLQSGVLLVIRRLSKHRAYWNGGHLLKSGLGASFLPVI